MPFHSEGIAEYQWNYLSIYRKGSFLRYLHLRSGWELPDLFYRLVIHARFLSSILFAVGFFPHLSAVFLSLTLFFELRFNFKFHTQFLMFCVLFLAGSNSVEGYALWYLDIGIQSDFVALGGIVFTVVAMYFFTAVQKMRSSDFLSGGAVRRTFKFIHVQQSRAGNMHAPLSLIHI